MVSPSPLSRAAVSVGRYSIRRKLGAGSMGTVYLAEDQTTRRLLALKLIRSDRLSAEAVSRLQEEFRAIAALHHPQIAAAYDFGYSEVGRIPYYTREYVAGRPLPPGPPGSGPPGEFLKPLLDLLDALEYLHAHGILHLDVHPGNLILADDPKRGSVLIDVSLFRSARGSQVSTAPDALAGLPPEVLTGGEVGPAADLFLVGRLLLYRLTGEAAREARLPRELPGWGPRRTLELERIAAKALQTDPRQRFRSAAEFRDALSRVLGEPGKPAELPEPGEVTVGRERELARIEAVLRDAASGRTGALLLAGAAGLGKSRLLDETRLRAQLLGLETVSVRFFPEAGPEPTLPGALQSARLGGRRKPRWLEPLDASHGGTPEERARRAARAFFEVEDEKPLALLLDDLDRADRGSFVLAQALLEESAQRRAQEGDPGRGLAVVVAARQPPRELFTAREVLTLRPLAASPARVLLRTLARPLVLPERLLREAVAHAGGRPSTLRHIARVLASEWRRSGLLPDRLDLHGLLSPPSRGGLLVPRRLSVEHREALRALAVVGRPVMAGEVAAALGLATAEAKRRLEGLLEAELVTAVRGEKVLGEKGRGEKALHYRAAAADVEEACRRDAPARQMREIHRRLAARLAQDPRLDLRGRESLARHLLRAGKRIAGMRRAISAASDLRRAGFHDRAVGLLEETISLGPRGPRPRFLLAEEASSILEESGDHRRALLLLEPFRRRGSRRLSTSEAVRLGRRLGVHYHRLGRAGEAAAAFEHARRLADSRRDLSELVFIDSELAELQNLRAAYDHAEEACRRGLERLRGLDSGDFRIRMELSLLATRGHLRLRRMELASAREDLRAAWRLSRRFRMPSLQAVILNNLGIAENQLNRFREAERCFRRAEKLLLPAGEGRPVVAIACNLAVIAAKRGEAEEARAQVDKASRLLLRYPGSRLEFLVSYTRGIVGGLLGDAAAVLESLPRALPLAAQVGDTHLARFGEIGLAEAWLACGRYRQASRLLRSAARAAEAAGPAVLGRMAQARLLFLAELVGERRGASRADKALGTMARTPLDLLETWNDLWVGFARLLQGSSAHPELMAACETFRRLGVVFGEHLARLGLLLEALREEDRTAVAEARRAVEEALPSAHRFLAVAAPLACAEAHLFLGDREKAGESLDQASSAMVGSQFLELDWRIELLRARLALKEGDTAGARGHLHRSLHARDLLLEHLPPPARGRMVRLPRFRTLEELAARLERSPRLHPSSGRLAATGAFQGMVGRSRAMAAVFWAIDRLRDQEIPVLILGETGTGKELAARALHRTSPRGKGPFFAIHAASLPVELFESELFGHERGAFTGAEEARPGLLETLKGGTLLLDEVGEMPLPAQAKLLRVLDSGLIRRLGGAEERRVDVRFLASSSADLNARVEEGRCRQDLFYRLRGMELRLPPLRERREDLPLLARHLLAQHARRLDRPAPVLAAGALRLLEEHPWPGNVRELEGVLLRAMVALSHAEALGVEDLRPFLVPAPGGPESPAPTLFREELLEGKPLEELRRELERAYLTRLFRSTGGDLRKMMETLGVRQSYLYDWMRKVGVDIRALRGGPSDPA